MRRIILIALSIMCISQASSAQGVIYEKADSLRVLELLSQAPALSSTNEYMMFFARQLMGSPYVAKSLEKGKEEKLVVNLREFDCTTFVETLLALSLCMKEDKRSWDDYTTFLRLIRYDEGEVLYPKRLHYFTSWIESNSAKGLVSEGEQASLPALFEETQTLNTTYMTTHPEQYPQLANDTSMVALIKDTELQLTGKKYKYIPKRLLQRETKALKRTISNGDIIALVTNKDGLDIAHIGIAAWHSDGTLHLINASQLSKKVVDEPMTLYNYMTKRPSQIGIRVIHPL